MPGLVLDPGTPATNMVFLSLDPGVEADAGEVAARLRSRRVLVGVTGKRNFRPVTHYWIDANAAAQAAAACAAALG